MKSFLPFFLLICQFMYYKVNSASPAFFLLANACYCIFDWMLIMLIGYSENIVCVDSQHVIFTPGMGQQLID